MAEEMDTNIDDGNNSPTEMAESTEIVETNIEEVVKMRKAKLDEALDVSVCINLKHKGETSIAAV